MMNKPEDKDGAERNAEVTGAGPGKVAGEVACGATAGSAGRADPWDRLRQFTNARIGLGRVGGSVPTAPWLSFSLAHAQARDAVHQPLAAEALHEALRGKGFNTLDVRSAVADRNEYLRRPDLGRRLSPESAAMLDARNTESAAGLSAAAPGRSGEGAPDIVFVVADGLSALAVSRHAVPLLVSVREHLGDWRLGPVVVASQARVALGDDIGERLGAAMVAVLIGERPGLSSPDSLGIYLTYAPRVGRNDAQRNCISNVRPEGLSYAQAAFKLAYLMNAARRLGLTGVGLKDESAQALQQPPAAARLDRG
ncbi:Ethanolamine ammonia-lyase light chain [Pandoraea terrae]|uniref:Ethanolamine ammonia-lyase small subunit n=1 Tax=Pandoraea terrae TaxID=1537710 RepID=A0A5E4W9C4_9BURK|nr:ethanolamine ammonia-lyase subunit EutC [Pandoraea terrae]VVE20459.1 Ethanolamine ammonia-lyase light chain [Pandoraea terrae]